MARAPKVTWERVSALIQAGHGTGFGEDYVPVLQIKRWNPSPVSVQVVKPLPPFRRQCHFFSHSEWFMGLLFSWVGAYVREQFPLWPWRHPHPEYDRRPACDASLPWSDGMEAICQEAGIKHGYFVGTNIPYIWTMDLCLHMPWVVDPAVACCFVSVKPLDSERYLYIDPLDRGPEKLEAERRYAKALRIQYFVGDRSLYPGPLFSQLEFLAEAAILPANHPLAAVLGIFLDSHEDEISSNPIVDSIDRLELDYKVTRDQATFLLNHMLWNQIVDCDLSKPIKNTLPPQPGGRRLRTAIRESIEKGGQK